jgi:hypothetical protein
MRSLLLVILLSVLAAEGHGADDQCGALERYMLAAPSNFKSLRAKQDEYGDWIPSVYLPQANKCMLEDQGDNHVRAICPYLFIDEQDRQTGMRQMQAAVERCLGWAPGDLRRSRGLSYKGVTGVEVSLRPFRKYDARLELEYVGR